MKEHLKNILLLALVVAIVWIIAFWFIGRNEVKVSWPNTRTKGVIHRINEI